MPKTQIKDNKLIVALDVGSLRQAKRLVNLLSPLVKFFKVGSQLFTAYGPAVIKMIKERHCKIFLDLKFYDIPNTVKNAVASAAHLKVDMLTVHLCGGKDMLKAAVQVPHRPKIIGVTVLTSQKDAGTQEKVLEFAKLAKQTQLEGVVCSVQEAKDVRRACGKDFLIITPGIRTAESSADDQRRVARPREAIAAGADFIVVGRSIIQAPDPLFAAEEILREIER